MLPFIPDI
jgi:hypothetical protein